MALADCTAEVADEAALAAVALANCTAEVADEVTLASVALADCTLVGEVADGVDSLASARESGFAAGGDGVSGDEGAGGIAAAANDGISHATRWLPPDFSYHSAVMAASFCAEMAATCFF